MSTNYHKGLADSEGGDTDFIGWLGDLEEVRHTLAFTSDGGRLHVQGNWQTHEESIDTMEERVIGYTCLGLELLGTDGERCGWANTDFVGCSWLKDDQFAATKDPPLFDAMVTRPPEIHFVGQRPSMKVSLEKLSTPPPPIA